MHLRWNQITFMRGSKGLLLRALLFMDTLNVKVGLLFSAHISLITTFFNSISCLWSSVCGCVCVCVCVRVCVCVCVCGIRALSWAFSKERIQMKSRLDWPPEANRHWPSNLLFCIYCLFEEATYLRDIFCWAFGYWWNCPFSARRTLPRVHWGLLNQWLDNTAVRWKPSSSIFWFGHTRFLTVSRLINIKRMGQALSRIVGAQQKKKERKKRPLSTGKPLPRLPIWQIQPWVKRKPYLGCRDS